MKVYHIFALLLVTATLNTMASHRIFTLSKNINNQILKEQIQKSFKEWFIKIHQNEFNHFLKTYQDQNCLVTFPLPALSLRKIIKCF